MYLIRFIKLNPSIKYKNEKKYFNNFNVTNVTSEQILIYDCIFFK